MRSPIQKIKFAIFWRNYLNNVKDILYEHHFPRTLRRKIIAEIQASKHRLGVEFLRYSHDEFIKKATSEIDIVFNLSMRSELRKNGIDKSHWDEIRDEILFKILGKKYKKVILPKDY